MASRPHTLTVPGDLRLTVQMHPDDAAVVARARDGDEEAFRLLVERHGRRLYRLAYRMTGRAQDAEDIVQDTFVRAYRQLAAFEARSNVATWLHRIAFNCAIDSIRARKSSSRLESLDAVEARQPRVMTPGADDLVFASEIDGRVQGALDTLSAEERAAFLLRHYHGCSIDEICRALDLRANAAKHAVFRAVKKMRTALAPFVGRVAAPAPLLKD